MNCQHSRQTLKFVNFVKFSRFPYISDHGCRSSLSYSSKFVFHVQVFSCLLPLVIMVATYGCSARTLLRKNKIPGASVGNVFRLRRRRQNQRVTQMFGIIVVIFFVMTTPYLGSFLVIGYYGTFHEQVYMKHEALLFDLQYAFYTLMGFNACINPFIYAVRYKDIGKTLKRFISTKRQRERIKRKIGVVQMVERKYGRSHQQQTQQQRLLGSV